MGLFSPLRRENVLKFPWKLHLLLKWLTKNQLKKPFSSFEIDIFHSPFSPLPLHGEIAGAPRVLTIHDLFPVTRPHFFLKSESERFKKILESIHPDKDHIICDSHATRNEFLKLFSTMQDRCCVVPLGVSDLFQPPVDYEVLTQRLAKWGIEKGEYILSVSTLEPRKNLPFLTACYDELVRNKEIKNKPLVLVGVDGWLGEPGRMRHLAKQLNGKVILAGYVDDQDLHALYSGAGVLIYVPYAEGFGLPPLEAMGCGTPVITSNCSALPEVVGDAAIKVDPTDGAGLRKAILTVISDKELRSDLISRGFERAKQFSWEKTVKMTAEVYREALKK